MYADPRHRKDVVIKLRLDEFCAELFRRYAAARHVQPAVLARMLVEDFMLAQGAELPNTERRPLDALVHTCAQREGVAESVWRQRAIEQYLAGKGYEVPDADDGLSRLAS